MNQIALPKWPPNLALLQYIRIDIQTRSYRLHFHFAESRSCHLRPVSHLILSAV